MIQSSNNRRYVFAYLTALFVFLIIVISRRPEIFWFVAVLGSLPLFAFSCPNCRSPTVWVGGVTVCPPFPKKCFRCDYTYD